MTKIRKINKGKNKISISTNSRKAHTLMASKKEIENLSLTTFIKHLNSWSVGYYKYCSKSYYYECKDNLQYLKDEIVENFIHLTNSQKKGYLEKIKHDLNKCNAGMNEDYINLIRTNYSQILAENSLEEMPINALMESREIESNYDSILHDLITFEFDPPNMTHELEIRQEKGNEWFTKYSKSFDAFNTLTIIHFSNELLSFIEENEKKYQLSPAVRNETNDLNSKPNMKLKWNGPKNILIDAFYQMKHAYDNKKQPYLPNSNEDVALFLKEHFDCFSDVALSTIIGQLKKSERPRKEEKRINIEKKP